MQLPGTRYSSIRDSFGSPFEDLHTALTLPPPSLSTKEATSLWAPHTRLPAAQDRRRQSIDQVTALVLDYDTLDEDLYPLTANVLHDANIEAYIYPTFTSPRFRVVLPYTTPYLAAPWTPQGMGSYLSSVLKALGLPPSGIDKSKLAPESIFYLPCHHPHLVPQYFDTPHRIKPPHFVASSLLETSLIPPIEPIPHTWPGPQTLVQSRDLIPSFFRLLLSPYRLPDQESPVTKGRRHRRVYAELRALAPFLRLLGPTPDQLVEALAPAWAILYPETPDPFELFALARDALRNPDTLPLGHEALPLPSPPPLPPTICTPRTYRRFLLSNTRRRLPSMHSTISLKHFTKTPETLRRPFRTPSIPCMRIIYAIEPESSPNATRKPGPI